MTTININKALIYYARHFDAAHRRLGVGRTGAEQRSIRSPTTPAGNCAPKRMSTYVDLGRLARVEAMILLGRVVANEWVRQVRVSYIVDTDTDFGDDFWLRVDTNERTEIG